MQNIETQGYSLVADARLCQHCATGIGPQLLVMGGMLVLCQIALDFKPWPCCMEAAAVSVSIVLV
jgi:hypothetical protein